MLLLALINHYNCYQLLIAVNPAGGMAYISEPFEGALSDRKIVEKCDILDFIERGDVILGNYSIFRLLGYVKGL